MKAPWRNWLAAALAVAGAMRAASAELPDFDEVYRLIRSNAVGVTEAELGQAAVEGLLTQLHSQVQLVTNATPTQSASPATNALVAVGRMFDRAFAYIRIGQVEAGVAEVFEARWREVSGSNRVDGLVLDLRFATGSDYQEAGRVADRFVATERPLLEWGSTKITATAKTNALTLPMTILVNGETAGAAEALAGALRQAGVGLMLGSATGGHASQYKEFPLRNGQVLRIASAPVKLGDGANLPAKGLRPDIVVAVKLNDERGYLDDPYRGATGVRRGTNVVGAATNRPARLTEADLVRMKRQGFNLDDDEPAGLARPPVAEAPVVTDPALARALDLLKGLAVFRPERPR